VPEPDALLEELAGAILDGTPVDWDAVEAQVQLSDRSLLDELRLLATLGGLHRQTSESASPTLERWGHLRVLEPLGRGAFGEVYRAWDTRLDREVALKLLPVDSIPNDRPGSSVIDEGRLLARVRHPNVVTIYGAERIGDRIGLWMELVKGRTLEETLQNRKVFTASEVIGIGLELCRAISAVHQADLLHRDIKAQNVMIGEGGRVVLMDFGTGRELSGRCAAVAGTPLYLAPELLNGSEATIQTDVYSLGVLLYHLLTNSYPVRAGDLRELREAHQRDESTPLTSVRPDLPARLTRIINRSIAREPEKRYATADALEADLARLVRPRALLWGRAAVASAILCVAWGAYEFRGWHTSGRSPTRSALSAWFPVGMLNVRPVEHPVIAVLPLENLSAEADSEYFADGLTEEIIRSLDRIQGLEVKSRTSSFAFKGKPRNIKEVGEQLGVNVILEGSVLRAASRVRVIPRLVQVPGDVTLWSDRFERDNTVKDVFAIQDEIARAIVNKLRLTLRTGQRRYDTDIDTYNLYLKARAMVARKGNADTQAAAKLLHEVIARDSGFAPAYAGLADAYAFISHTSLEPGFADTYLPLMQQAAEKALELDELLAEGHAAMGFVYSRKRDWESAEKSFRCAIELNPSLTQSYSNFVYSTLIPLERLREAEDLLRVALRVDPLSPDLYRDMGFVLINAGRYDEAIDHLMRARALQPDLPYVALHLPRALTFAGRTTEALALWEPTAHLPGIQGWMSHAYVRVGRRTEVEQFAKTHDLPYRLALIYAALGDKDRTFEALDRAAETVPHRTVALLTYPEMRLLRGDPRLAALRKKLNLP
jgi:eukaryotic-like serine/threonine-protein kinase